MYKYFLKRIIDFITAIAGLLILSPILLLVTIGLTIANEGRPFFFQLRPGKHGKIFKIVKFKTMNDKKDAEGVLLSDAKRLTTIGSLVRKTSLDELPQLLNVVKGDMSLIGPRPLLPEYLPMYNEVQKRRHEVRPGITGLAQVKGRNQMKFSERLKNDVYYVNHLSFFFDIKILVMTVQSVIFKTNTVVIGQTVDDVDDIGLSKNLSSNHFKSI
jgi:undecaprenyl phosphate N,N'-diacetylbacillosamine 1-phosphate transferase